jgi:hypothetical protein
MGRTLTRVTCEPWQRLVTVVIDKRPFHRYQ